MKEIITFLIVSGGLGFFNLYIAQESDLLYFGKYNKEERLAWLSIYSVLNFLFIKLCFLIYENINSLTYGKILSVLIALVIIILDVIMTFVLPIVLNKMIECVRRLMKALMSRLWTGFFGTARCRYPEKFSKPGFQPK
ncbi:hypothetical protein, partial [Weissella cibaria]